MRKKHAPSPPTSARVLRAPTAARVSSSALPTVAALLVALAACDRGTPSPTPSASRDLATTAPPSTSASASASVVASGAPSSSASTLAELAPSASSSTSASPSGSVALAAPCSASVHVVPHVPPTPIGGINPLNAQMHMAGGAMPVSAFDPPGTVAPPKAQVAQGGVVTKGPLTKSAAEPVLAKAQPRLRACYQKALLVDPTTSGVVSFRLTVGAGGEVQSVTTSTSMANPSAVECMKAALMGLKFPADEGGASSEVTAPFGFHST